MEVVRATGTILKHWRPAEINVCVVCLQRLDFVKLQSLATSTTQLRSNVKGLRMEGVGATAIILRLSPNVIMSVVMSAPSRLLADHA